jgi:phosphoribosylanthranilate isomerase
VTRASDALLASELGASAVGFVFWDQSPRAIQPIQAAEIAALLPPEVAVIGVFVNPLPGLVEEVSGCVGLSAVQLHGDETPEFCRALPYRVIKSVSLRGPVDAVTAVQLAETVTPLVDVYDPEKKGGTGRTVDWALAATVARQRRIILAGGLTPANVVEAVRVVRPCAIDVSSGLEISPGIKSPELLQAFFCALSDVVQTSTE